MDIFLLLCIHFYYYNSTNTESNEAMECMQNKFKNNTKMQLKEN